MMQIYVRFDCPYCLKVISVLKESNLEKNKDYELINGEAGTIGRETILKIGGKGQVPFMVDGTVKMYESNDIIYYIKEKLKKGQ